MGSLRERPPEPAEAGPYWGRGKAEIERGPDGTKWLVLRSGEGYEVPPDGGAPVLIAEGQAAPDMAYRELWGVLVARNLAHGGTAREAFHHWEACPRGGATRCRRCAGIESRAKEFAQRRGLLGLGPRSVWSYVDEFFDVPEEREWAARRGWALYEPLTAFLLRAGQLTSWAQHYAEASHRPDQPWHWVLPFFDGPGTSGDYARGQEDPRLLHPGLNVVLADARLEIGFPLPARVNTGLAAAFGQGPPSNTAEGQATPPATAWYLNPARAWEAPVWDPKPTRCWRCPSLWVGLHVQLLNALVRGNLVLRRCAHCGRPFEANPAYDRRYCRSLCADARRHFEQRRGDA